MAEMIASGLRRKSVQKCSRWAEEYRVMGAPFPGKWTFKYHPWLREMHDSTAQFNCGMKSAQGGFTETVLNRVFYNVDVRALDCLYVLPAQTPDAHDFSASRFNAALELSPHLGNLFSDVQNIGHKRAGATNLYIRGSRSRSGLKAIPTACIILDELDEMTQENIPLALERAAGQKEKEVWAISTPTIPGEGINVWYQDSTQESFYFKCPSCSKSTTLIFPQCLEVVGDHINDPRLEESYIKCKECSAKLEHHLKYEWLKDGFWVPEKQHGKRGFHINQLYSSTVTPGEIANWYMMSMRDVFYEQQLYNSKLGLPHIVAGAGVTDANIDACIGGHRNNTLKRGLNTMGVDIGKVIHFNIDNWHIQNAGTTDPNAMATPETISFGKVQEFDELDPLMRAYNISSCIVDINPDTRKAWEFACRFPGLVRLCRYTEGVTGRVINVKTDEDNKPVIHVDRTTWLDLSLGRFKNGSIKIPMDTNLEYRSQIKANVRVYDFDRWGQRVGRYRKKQSDEDHYAHARNYSEIALPFALSIKTHQDLEHIP